MGRIQYIDLAKGFGIMLVVVYHIYYHLHNMQVIMPISLFMLPLFFFLSGLFFKEYGSFSDFIVRKINKLLIPFPVLLFGNFCCNAKCPLHVGFQDRTYGDFGTHKRIVGFYRRIFF